MSTDCRVSFTFDSCEESIITRSVLAAVDQLCAATDVEVSLLDALEVPIAEFFSVIYPFGIGDAEVSVDDGRLGVHVGAESDLGESTDDVLGEAADLIQPFFDEIEQPSSTCIRMTASLT